MVEILIKLLEKKAFCQTKVMDMADEDECEDLEDAEENPEDDEDEDEDDEDDGIDHDEIILGNVSDLIISISRALGNHF